VLHDVDDKAFIVSIPHDAVNTTNVLGRLRPLWAKQWWIAIGWAMPYRAVVAGAPPFGWIALIDPTRYALVEDPKVAIAFGVQLFVGQTGQLVGTSSIQND